MKIYFSSHKEQKIYPKRFLFKDKESSEFIESIYAGVSTNPNFTPPPETPKKTTILDTFAIPEETIANTEKFQKWFEERFFYLDETGVSHFSDMCQQALEILYQHQYLLSPRKNCPSLVSQKIEKMVRKGFQTKEAIHSFLKKVALPNTTPNTTKFFAPERKNFSGAEKLSTCRILSVAYLLELIRVSEQFQGFVKNLNFILGQGENPFEGNESGILSGMHPKNTQESIIQNIENYAPDSVLEWVEGGEILKDGVYLNINKRTFFIPEFHSGVKGGLRVFLKLFRKPEEEFQIMTDVFRMRFIFENDTPKGEILEILHGIQEEAKQKKDPEVEVSFKEKNYFTKNERENFFPEVLKSKQIDNKIIPQERGNGILDKITVDSNENSGKGFRSLSAIVQQKRKGKVFFAFEIQCLTREELANNEREETPEDHFLYKFRQLTEVISRSNGALTKKEIIEAIKEFILHHVAQEKMPKKIAGNITKTKRERRFEMPLCSEENQTSFEAQEIAETLFEFFIKEGTLQKIHMKFPNERTASSKTISKSTLYLHQEITKRITNILDGKL